LFLRVLGLIHWKHF